MGLFLFGVFLGYGFCSYINYLEKSSYRRGVIDYYRSLSSEASEDKDPFVKKNLVQLIREENMDSNETVKKEKDIRPNDW